VFMSFDPLCVSDICFMALIAPDPLDYAVQIVCFVVGYRALLQASCLFVGRVSVGVMYTYVWLRGGSTIFFHRCTLTSYSYDVIYDITTSRHMTSYYDVILWRQ
jgi:hypothetical protein